MFRRPSLKLYINDIDLAEFGVLQVLSQSNAYEPPEAPQREKVTVRCRLDFFEQTYAENYTLVEQTRSALRAHDEILQWQDGGSNYIKRPVTILDHDLPQESNAQGTYHQAITFTFTYTNYQLTNKCFGATFLRSGAVDGDVAVGLGQVEKFADDYTTTLFDEMRSNRRRVAGRVSMSGRIKVSPTLSVGAAQLQLETIRAQLRDELVEEASGRLTYGRTDETSGAITIFDKVVRVMEFSAQVNQSKHFVEWSLTAGYTRFPNESDYALCEFQVTPRENNVDGSVTLAFSGKIDAPTKEAALAKLAVLQAAAIPADGYVQTSAETDPRYVRCDSKEGDEEIGDGESFIEMSFSQEWRKHDANVVEYTARTSDADDAVSGFVRTTVSGNVLAVGASLAAATAVATAKAAALGAGKYPILIQSTLTPQERQFLTSGGKFFVALEFSYEYRRRGGQTWYEVTGELKNDSFGQSVETVSGFIEAPTLASALAVYNSDIRAQYNAALLLSEQKPTLSSQTLKTKGTLTGRFSFSLSVHRNKAVGATAMSYSIEPVSDLVNLEKTSTVNGTVYAVTEAAAEAYLTTFLASLSLGVKKETRRRSASQQGPSAGGAQVTGFFQMDFTEVYVAQLTGVDGVLECEVTEEIQYSGTRWVEQPLPDRASLFQDCGIEPGHRSVSGSVKATTRVTAEAWAKKCRNALISGDYEEPPRVSVTHKFLPLTDGVVSGANVKLYECSFNFSERIPEIAYV